MSEFLAAADRIGARLCRDALWSRDRCTWTGAAMTRIRGAWRVVERTCGPSLYDGTAGVALVLARLGRLTGEAVYEGTALAALRQALARRGDVPADQRWGLHGGWAGLALAARACGSGEAGGLLDGLGADTRFDLLGGGAGAIPVLLSIGGGRALERAVSAGEALVRGARPRERGVAWGDGLTGMAHGASGIAWSLLELHHATGESRFRDAARAALEYERSQYVASQSNWRDRRLVGDACNLAWCHGAPGIGLARTRIRALDPSDAVDGDLAAARRATAGTVGPEVNFSLCHGQAGNAELWIECGELDRAREIGRAGIARFEERGRPWPCGIQGGGDAPGLMVGLAGIAWFLLRLHDPAAHPSVLLPVPARWAQFVAKSGIEDPARSAAG